MSDDRISRQRSPDVEKMAEAIDAFLDAAGFDTKGHPHLGRSGQRVADAWSGDLLEGYGTTPSEALGTPFTETSGDLVLVKDIEFFSSCPHHLMPYQGKAHIAYVPDGLAVGFSGIVRLLDCIAHRMTLQEWLSRDVVATLMSELRPKGAACILQATPMCVLAGGVRRPCRIDATSFDGVFREDAELRRDVILASVGES
ncbi:MAG TPA: GTP cyclohydrolase I FolE [Deltaproteobacteria bacterium]|nr:GTP cyclohydrolase I FolE [Deltaproteobacteria bacterium]HCP45723.1 GTP cyclohydrolase I FolE [Deltaproteobacteria bacterium]